MYPTNQLPWLPPVIYWTLIQSLTGLTVTFTGPKSPLRPIIAASTALLAYALTVSIQTHFARARASGPLVAMCWVNVLNAVDLLVLCRASYAAQRVYDRTKDAKKDKIPEEEDDSSVGRRKLLYALIIPYNLRRINTPWTISCLPLFDARNPAYVPGRRAFLFQSVIKLLVSTAIVAVIGIDPDDRHLEGVITQLNDSPTVLLFRDCSARKLLIQCLFAVSFGIATRATIVGGYTSTAFLAVLCGLEPSSWPPIAGNLTQASSLEGLWGSCWHQLLRRPLTSTATFLTSLLGIHPKSGIAHWTRVVIAFTASGAIHSIMDIAFGVPLSKTGGFWFFSLQILGVLVETGLKRLDGLIGLSNVLGRNGTRVLGYLWVCVWLLWTVPVWINPILLSLWAGGTKVMSPWLGVPAGWISL
ncbi:membrane bound O-acyl transferase family-domain-containing protein [Aspergillus californicus]